MTTKTIAGNNKNLVEVDLNPLHPGLSGGTPTTLIIIPWNASHLLFSGFTTFPTPPHGFSPLAFQSMFMCVCVLCKRSWVGGLVTRHHPLPPLSGVCVITSSSDWWNICVCGCAHGGVQRLIAFLGGFLVVKTWPNYLIIFIWPKGWWLDSIGSSKKGQIQENKSKKPK